jgi:hypothetical protein
VVGDLTYALREQKNAEEIYGSAIHEKVCDR